QPTGNCTVCGSPANILRREFRVGVVVNCSRCGDFQVSHVVADDVGLPFTERKNRALATYNIRKMQKPGAPRPQLAKAFFTALQNLGLPSPANLMDSLPPIFAEHAHERPGRELSIRYNDEEVLGTIGAVEPSDAEWVIRALVAEKLLEA